MGALIVARDEAAYAGLLGGFIEVERLGERVPLKLAHDCAECPPDVVPRWVVRVVVQIVVDGLTQSPVLLP